DLPSIDLLIGGSPCQGFSFAGKQLNFEDPRSALFFEFVRLKGELNPTYFMLENVNMKKEYRDIISGYLGVEPILINSALVSAQSRARWYWTNIPGVEQPEDLGMFLADIVESNTFPVALHNLYGGFNEKAVRVFSGKSPTLRTAAGGGHIPSFVTESLIHSEKALAYMDREVKGGRNHWDFKHHSDIKNEKSATVVANFFKGVPYNVFNDWNVVRKFHPIECERLQTVPKVEKCGIVTLCLDQIKNYVSAVERNPKLLKLALNAEKSELSEHVSTAVSPIHVSPQSTRPTAQPNVDMQTPIPTGLCTPTSHGERFLSAETVGKKIIKNCLEQEESSVTQNAFICSTEGRITHVGKGVSPRIDQNSIAPLPGGRLSKQSGIGMMQLVEDVAQSLSTRKGKSSTYTTSSPLSMSNLEQMLIISYWSAKSAINGFTPERTMKISLYFNFTDGYTNHVSPTQRYKMLGNGWTVDVVAHIFKNINKP
nr:DNA cytosine methyltransferase [Spirochaetales bacterium]